MKIKIATPKPRNPVALPARQRKAGAHGAFNQGRQQRRVEKYNLRLMLMGRKGENDA
ncbi:MAG TPA: hypothetical protein VIF60_23865 [Burkholderiaceae bacterium]|jgi:hypothetical protein